MTNKFIKLSAICLFGMIKIQAQECISSTGGNNSEIGGSISYTVGQIVYTANTVSSGTLVQGVQQPFGISDITDIENINKSDIKCSIFPNPTTNSLHLKVDLPSFFNSQIITYQLYNIVGKLLESKSIINETNINMRNFVPSTYLLKVKMENRIIRIIKIIKI